MASENASAHFARVRAGSDRTPGSVKARIAAANNFSPNPIPPDPGAGNGLRGILDGVEVGPRRQFATWVNGRKTIIETSEIKDKYTVTFDRESAYEMLSAKFSSQGVLGTARVILEETGVLEPAAQAEPVPQKSTIQVFDPATGKYVEREMQPAVNYPAPQPSYQPAPQPTPCSAKYSRISGSAA